MQFDRIYTGLRSRIYRGAYLREMRFRKYVDNSSITDVRALNYSDA